MTDRPLGLRQACAIAQAGTRIATLSELLPLRPATKLQEAATLGILEVVTNLLEQLPLRPATRLQDHGPTFDGTGHGLGDGRCQWIDGLAEDVTRRNADM